MQCEIILKQCHRMVTTCIYFSNLVKVIVQPKMKKKKKKKKKKNLLSFSSNPELFSSIEFKGRYFEECL